MSYATMEAANTPLIIQEVENMKADAKFSRSIVLTGMALAFMFSFLTFGACLLALEHTKETTVVDSVLVSSSTGRPVATRTAEQSVNALEGNLGRGVQYITLVTPDGGLARYNVANFQKYPCTRGASKQCNDDGFEYIFATTSGLEFAGYTTIDNNGNAQLTFSQVMEKTAAQRQLLGGRVLQSEGSGSSDGTLEACGIGQYRESGQCKFCEWGTFSDSTGDDPCVEWSTCDVGYERSRGGADSHDVGCTECKDGMWKYQAGNDRMCQYWTPCQYGIQIDGSTSGDQICSPQGSGGTSVNVNVQVSVN